MLTQSKYSVVFSLSCKTHDSAVKVQSHPITLGVLLGVFTEIELNYFGLMSNTDAVLLDVSTIPAVSTIKTKSSPLW